MNDAAMTSGLNGRLDESALDQLFRAARTHNGWQDRPVPEGLLSFSCARARARSG